jgi:uncharacterized membrane protein
MAENRVETIERQIRELTRRLERLEGHVPASSPPRKAAPSPSEAGPRPAAPSRPSRPEPLTATSPARPRPGAPAGAPGSGGFESPRTARAPRPRPQRRSIEELLSPRVLALAGGVVTLLGVAFFVAVGISRGWIGPEMRVIASGVLSLALAAAGTVLHRRGEETLGSILVATAISGAYATLLGATVLYDFIPEVAGLAGALAVASAGTTLGLRWGDRSVVALALGGALAAPLLIEAPSESITAAYLVIALGGAAVVTGSQRWWGLVAAAVALALPQLSLVAFDDKAAGVVGLAVAWLEISAITLAPVLTAREKSWRDPIWIWALASSVCALVGYAALFEDPTWDAIWVFSFAAAHLLVALGARRFRPDTEGLYAFTLLAGAGLAALGAALVLDGPALVVAWAGKAALLTLPREDNRTWRLPWDRIGAIVLFAMAAAHTLIYEAPPGALSDGLPDDLDAALALGALALAAATAIRFVEPRWRAAPALALLAVLAYAIPLFTSGETSVALWSGLALAGCACARPLGIEALSFGAWAVLGLAVGDALTQVATLTDAAGDPEVWPILVATISITAAAAGIAIVRAGAERTSALILSLAAPAYAALLLLDGSWETLALGALAVVAAHLPRIAAWRRALLGALVITIAVGQTLIVVAPPSGLGSGVDDLGGALASLGILAGASLAAALAFRGTCVRVGESKIGLVSAGQWLAGIALIYAGSISIVDLVGGETSSLGVSGIAQPAQVALSAYWAVIGVVAVVAGLRLGRRSLRHSGLGLLGLALGKIFLLDLSSLDASYRAVSFIAVGLLLLAASLAYRRLATKERERPDLPELELTDQGGNWLAPCLGVFVALVAGVAIASADVYPVAALSSTATEVEWDRA